MAASAGDEGPGKRQHSWGSLALAIPQVCKPTVARKGFSSPPLGQESSRAARSSDVSSSLWRFPKERESQGKPLRPGEEGRAQARAGSSKDLA